MKRINIEKQDTHTLDFMRPSNNPVWSIRRMARNELYNHSIDLRRWKSLKSSLIIFLFCSLVPWVPFFVQFKSSNFFHWGVLLKGLADLFLLFIIYYGDRELKKLKIYTRFTG